MPDYPDGTLPISITAYTIATLPVDISAQTIGNIAVNIAAQSLAQLNVNISASAVTLNVNISASAVTLNISVTGQTVGVKIEAEWQIAQGNQKTLHGSAAVASGDTTYLISYTVPSGKRLYIFNMSWSSKCYDIGVAPKKGFYGARLAGLTIWSGALDVNQHEAIFTLAAPIRVDAGQTWDMRVVNYDTALGEYSANCHGFEVSV